MSTLTNLRDKIEHLFAVLFGIVEPIGEHVLVKTSQDVAMAALTGKVHGSDDMINVVKVSLQGQLPQVRNEAITAAAALVTHHEAEAAVVAPVVAPAVEPKEGE